MNTRIFVLIDCCCRKDWGGAIRENNINNRNEVFIAVTGTAWIGGGVGSVHGAIENVLSTVESEIQIAVFEITKSSFGFLELVRKCLARGLRVSMIVNRYQEKQYPIKERLMKMVEKYPDFYLYNFTPDNKKSDLHAKILVVDRQKAIIGSAYLTWNGMIGNHEMAAVLSGNIAWQIGSLLDRLYSDSHASRILVDQQ